MYIPGTDIPEDHAAALLREIRYDPGPAAGPVVILASQQFYDYTGSPDLGWGALLRPGWESHEVPGDHNSMIAEPYVHTLAARLAECLERASIDDAPEVAEVSSRPSPRRTPRDAPELRSGGEPDASTAHP